MSVRAFRQVGFVVLLAVAFAVSCHDDPVVDSTPTSSAESPSKTTDSLLDGPGSHDASVIVTYTITGDGSGPDPQVDQLAQLEDRLVDAIEPKGIGELDGDEFGEGTVTLRIYGPDLDALWSKVEAILKTYPARPAHAELRDGGPEQPARRVDL